MKKERSSQQPVEKKRGRGRPPKSEASKAKQAEAKKPGPKETASKKDAPKKSPSTAGQGQKPTPLPEPELTKIAVCNIDTRPEHYRFRKDEDISSSNLAELKESIRIEGLRDPFKVFPSEDDPTKFIVLDGHCRLSVLLMLIQENVADFTGDMKVRAFVY
jgi:hypothetical protein